jgi:hypothetical protein
LDHLEDPRSKEFGGSLQSSLLLRLSRSISTLLTEFSTLKAQPCHAANALLRTPTPQSFLVPLPIFRAKLNSILPSVLT